MAFVERGMGRMPAALREIIGINIRTCRMEKYPGRGGASRCAKEIGVSLQQWSPWETGKRTPDEVRLRKIADFFGVTVEFLRADNSRHIVDAAERNQAGIDDLDGVSSYQHAFHPFDELLSCTNKVIWLAMHLKDEALVGRRAYRPVIELMRQTTCLLESRLENKG